MDPCKEEEIEKKLIQDFFNGKKKGFFVEVGANEPDLLLSQTFHLEKYFDWEGILIEPIDYLCDKLRDERSRSKTYQVACTSSEKVGEVILRIPIENDVEITGHAAIEINVDHSLLHETKDIKVKAVTLNTILENEGVKKVDFLSIDVEGTELDVLKGFDLGKYSPELIIVEDRLVFLSKHIYMKNFGYKLFRRTGFNNWYVKSDRVPKTSYSTKVNLFRKIYLSSWIKRVRETFRMRTFKTFLRI